MDFGCLENILKVCGINMTWFDWLLTPEARKRKQEAQQKLEQDLANAVNAPRLHGVNLNEFHYLGMTKLSIENREGNKVYGRVYFFVHKETQVRKYIVKGTSQWLTEQFEQHQWVIVEGELWAAGEREIYQSVYDEPSRYLKSHMMELGSWVWGVDKKWWVVASQDAKYAAATTQQKTKEEKPEARLVRDNVVKVSFKKDDATV